MVLIKIKFIAQRQEMLPDFRSLDCPLTLAHRTAGDVKFWGLQKGKVTAVTLSADETGWRESRYKLPGPGRPLRRLETENVACIPFSICQLYIPFTSL